MHVPTFYSLKKAPLFLMFTASPGLFVTRFHLSLLLLLLHTQYSHAELAAPQNRVTSHSEQIITSRLVANSSSSSNTVSFQDSSSRLPDSSSYSGVAMAVVDMNQDGRDDIVRLRRARDLFIDYQQSDGSFEALALGTPSSTNQWGMAIGDTDNNGFPDIISGGYFDGLYYWQANTNGSSYTQSELDGPSIFLQSISFADIDNDGALDLFPLHDLGSNPPYRNNGSGQLIHDPSLLDTATSPVSDNSGNYGIVWCDYDGDGDSDLYISKCRIGVNSSSDVRRINQLFRNNGDGSFSEVAALAGLADGSQSWTADFADYDNDGDFDCFIGNHLAPSRLMRNNGDGTFTDVSLLSELAVDFNVIQAIFRDFNNDGWVDLLVTGTEHALWVNDRDGTFSEIPNPFSANAIESAAVGDLNQDGFTDIYAGYAQIYNTPRSSRPDRLFLSENNGNGFLALTLEGQSSNRLASGAVLELHGPWGIQMREVRSGEGYGITNSFTQIFGMGSAPAADRLVVRWPSGTVDTVFNPAAGDFLTLREGETLSVNTGPNLSAISNQNNETGETISLSIRADDPDGDPLTYTASGLPPGISISASMGTLTGSPSSAGNYSVSIQVSDGRLSASRSFAWTITTNTTPSALAFGGSLPTLPARIESENYDTGGSNVSYYDLDSNNIGGSYRNDGVDLEDSLDNGGTPSIGWTEEGEWLHYSIALTPGSYDLIARAASAFDEPGSLRVLLDGLELGVIDIAGTGDWYNWQNFTLSNITITGNGPALLRLEIRGASFNLNWVEFVNTGTSANTGDQAPFGTGNSNLPGRIQAEHFDHGPSGDSFFDLDPENIGGIFRTTSVDLLDSQDLDNTPAVGWIENREWLEYTIQATPGSYDFEARVASAANLPGAIRVLLDNKELGILPIPTTGGWDQWLTVTLPALTINGQGSAVLRLEFMGGPFQLNWFEFRTNSTGGGNPLSGQRPFFAQALSLPGRIEAENYDQGGAGVAYQDNEEENLTGFYRSEGVDIEPSQDIDQSSSLGWFDNAEWLEYTVEPEPGTYTISARVAAGAANPGDLRLVLDGRLLTTFSTPDIGGPNLWTTLTATGITIPSGGLQVLQVEAVGDSTNLNWIEFTRTDSPANQDSTELIERAFGQAEGATLAQSKPQLNRIGTEVAPALSFLTRLGGSLTETGYRTNDFHYRPRGSRNLQNWELPLIKVDNPPNLPMPPAGYKYLSYRLLDEDESRAFLRIEVTVP